MRIPRNLTAYLALAALLFGNVAGWMHIGCSSPNQSCCTASVDQDIASLSACRDHVAPESYAKHACCHHDHAVAEKQSPRHADSAGDDSVPTPADEHDPDQCSICQSFFSSRHAVVLPCQPTLLEAVLSAYAVFTPDDALLDTAISGNHWDRGPPRV